MKTLKKKGGGKTAKEKLKWAGLTDKKLQPAEGKRDKFTGGIEPRTGETPEAFEKAIKEIFAD